MAVQLAPPPERFTLRDAVPPLENGDHLSRDEFERRYSAMPRVRKAELIDGVVYMSSPVSLLHSTPHLRAATWLSLYAMATLGVNAGDNSTVRLDFDTEPQPDVFLMIDPECGGQASIDKDNFIDGAPELVLEVSNTTVSIDLHEKFRAYRRNGVREYIVWRTRDAEIDWFVLRGSDYARLEPGSDGLYRSEVFPGLVLDMQALLAGDMMKVTEVQQAAWNSPAHREFIEKLAAAREKRVA